MKHVISKSYYGLGGNLAVLSTAMLLADRLNRKIVIDWRRGHYGGEDNYFLELFEQLNNQASIDEIPKSARIFPDYWSEYYREAPMFKNGVPLTMATTDLVYSQDKNLDIDEFDAIVISRDSSFFHKPEFGLEMRSIFRRLIPNSKINEEILQYKRQCFKPEMIGVHFRHGNGEPTVIPPDLSWFIKSIKALKEKCDSSTAGIFLATDCSAVVHAFKEEFGNLVLTYEKQYLPLGAGGMHYEIDKEKKLRSAIDALVDIKLLSCCNFFVGSKSFFSTCANYWNEGYTRDNSRWYMPAIRSFKPEVWMRSLKDSSYLFELFDGSAYPCDNLYYKQGDIFEIFYQHLKVGDINLESDSDAIQKIKSQISKIRLY
jgi:hypothetical protein